MAYYTYYITVAFVVAIGMMAILAWQSLAQLRRSQKRLRSLQGKTNET